MIKEEAYPWIGIVIGGIVGLLATIIISDSISYFPYSTEGVDWVEVFAVSAFISLPVAWVVVIVISIKVGTDEGIVAGILSGVWGFFIGSIGGYIIGGIMGLIIVAIAPIFLDIALGAVTGIVICIARGYIEKIEDVWDLDKSFFLPVISVIAAIGCGIIAWGLGSEFIANIIIIPMFGSIGYVIGKEMGKTATERENKLNVTRFNISLATEHIKSAKELGLNTQKEESILRESLKLLKRGKYERVKDLAGEAQKTAVVYLGKHSVATEAIQTAKTTIEMVKVKCNVQRSDNLLKEANATLETALKEGDIEGLEKAKKLAGDAFEITKQLEAKSKDATVAIQNARKTVEAAKAFGCIAQRPESLLKEADLALDTALGRGDPKGLEKAKKLADEVLKVAKQIKAESKPEMEIKFIEKGFRVDTWKRAMLEVSNVGEAHAKDVGIDFSKEVAVKDLEGINTLNRGESKELEFMLKSMDTGEVPVDVKVSFSSLDGTSYGFDKRFYLSVIQGVAGVKEYEIPVGEEIEIKRGYEILQNNDLRFGIRIINNTGYAVMDAETILDYPRTLFALKDNVVQTLANIHPNGERTAKYILTPLGCIHNEKIDATIIYKDHTGEKQAVQMRPKKVHCVCPFLKEKAMREGEFAELANTHEHIQEGLSFSGISVNEIADFIKEACTHRLYVISEHEIDTAKIVYLAGESIGDKAYYLLTAVIQPYKDLIQVALRAYSDKSYGLHGFLNEIANSIRHLVGSVQSAKEIGIIESKQVINIIDSVVQRTSFGGTEAGATSVNIGGIVVQRTEIGTVKKCPICGKEVQMDKRFCPACSARLE